MSINCWHSGRQLAPVQGARPLQYHLLSCAPGVPQAFEGVHSNACVHHVSANTPAPFPHAPPPPPAPALTFGTALVVECEGLDQRMGGQFGLCRIEARAIAHRAH